MATPGPEPQALSDEEPQAGIGYTKPSRLLQSPVADWLQAGIGYTPES